MPQPWKAQRHKRGHWLQEQIGNNDQSVWLQRKSVARCQCTDSNKARCLNLDAGSNTDDIRNITCACRCHKGV